MTAEMLAKLKAAGLTDAEIDGLGGAAEIATLKKQLMDAEGKASGILSDKKKKQQEAEELRARLEELEGKGLGEVEKTKLELERLKSKYDAEVKTRSDLETTYKTERRNAEIANLTQRIKFLESVPEDARRLLISTELAGIEDLGNTVLVDSKLSEVSKKYAGMISATVPSGAGTKPSQQPSNQGSRPSLDVIKNTSLKDIAKDPKAFVRESMAAIDAAK